jgi:DNA-binding LacI/PurR family transcriptional regulator
LNILAGADNIVIVPVNVNGNYGLMRKTTIEDIAREAGVSAQTVSRVINNRPDVAEATRRRVQAIIKQHNYKPNAIAQGLRAQRTSMIGLIIETPDKYGPSAKFTELDKHAHRLGYRLLPILVHEGEPRDISGFLGELLSYQPDGIIWGVTELDGDQERFGDLIVNTTVPIVTMGTSIPGVPKPAAIDQLETSQKLTTHLIEQGFRNIGVVTGPQVELQAIERLQGWKKALLNVGLATQDKQICEGDWSSASGSRCMEQLLQTYPEIDALFVANDQMALGAMGFTREHGLRIPEDLGIVAFDDIPEAAYFNPGLTTARQPFREFCEIIVESLVNMISKDQEDQDTFSTETRVLYPQIVVRASSQRLPKV